MLPTHTLVGCPLALPTSPLCGAALLPFHHIPLEKREVTRSKIAINAGFGSILKILMIATNIWKPFSRDCSNHAIVLHVYTKITLHQHCLIQVLSEFTHNFGRDCSNHIECNYSCKDTCSSIFFL